MSICPEKSIESDDLMTDSELVAMLTQNLRGLEIMSINMEVINGEKFIVVNLTDGAYIKFNCPIDTGFHWAPPFIN